MLGSEAWTGRFLSWKMGMFACEGLYKCLHTEEEGGCRLGYGK